ncbi:unnamed protein product, partial [Mesorhabditis spiculigera]
MIVFLAWAQGGKCYTDSSLPSCSNPVSPLPKELPTPTDAELDALYNDMLHKDSPLETLAFAHPGSQQQQQQHSLNDPTTTPVMHNVSLGVPLTQANLTDVMPQMNFSCELPCPPALVGASAIPSAAFNSSHFWHNHTEGPLPGYLRTEGLNNLTMAVQQMCHNEPVLAEIGAVNYSTNVQPPVVTVGV